MGTLVSKSSSSVFLGEPASQVDLINCIEQVTTNGKGCWMSSEAMLRKLFLFLTGFRKQCNVQCC